MSPAQVVADEAGAPGAFTQNRDGAVEGERGVGGATQAVGVAGGGGDGEDDAR